MVPPVGLEPTRLTVVVFEMDYPHSNLFYLIFQRTLLLVLIFALKNVFV